MIKKTITYFDFEGKERTDDFFFSLNQLEFTKMNTAIPGGMEAYLEKIQKDNDEDAMLNLVISFITQSYGERTPDGKGFIKKDKEGRPLGDQFICTEACDNLITELLTNENAIASFLTGILPTSVQGKVEEGMKALREGNSLTALPKT